MKSQTGSSIRERLAKWQAVHSLLFRDDAQFRMRHISFLIAIICLSIPLMAVYCYYFEVGMTSFAVDLAVIVCVSSTVIYLSLRHLHFVNRRIEGYLQSSHNTWPVTGATRRSRF